MLDSESSTVRRRKADTEEQELVVVDVACPRDQCVKTLRLVALVLVTVAALATTSYLLLDEWEHTYMSSAEECAEMKDIDQAVRSLGLDGLPGYRESCFILQERLGTAAQPFTGPAADLLQEGTQRLHRAVRRLEKVVTFVPRVTFRMVAAFIEWQADMVVIAFHQHAVDVEGGVIHHQDDKVPLQEPHDGGVHQEELGDQLDDPQYEEDEKEPDKVPQEDIMDELEEEEPDKVPQEDIMDELEEEELEDELPEEELEQKVLEDEVGETSKKDVPPSGGSEEEQEPGADVTLVLTQNDLRVLVTRMAALFGHQVDEARLDDLVHSLGSRRSSPSPGAPRSGHD